MSKHAKDVEEEAKADMTPMIDAVFLLIIFFLCIDFKVLEAKLPAYLPKDKGSNNDDTPPIEQLSLKIICQQEGTPAERRPGSNSKNNTMLVGHVVRWELGPKRYDDLDKLKDDLTDIANDPRRRVPDLKNPGKMKIMPIVIEPQPKTTYGDVATTVDAVSAAKFEEINFGGGRGAK